MILSLCQTETSVASPYSHPCQLEMSLEWHKESNAAFCERQRQAGYHCHLLAGNTKQFQIYTSCTKHNNIGGNIVPCRNSQDSSSLETYSTLPQMLRDPAAGVRHGSTTATKKGIDKTGTKSYGQSYNGEKG